MSSPVWGTRPRSSAFRRHPGNPKSPISVASHPRFPPPGAPFLSRSTARSWVGPADWGLPRCATRYDAAPAEEGPSANAQGREQYAKSDAVGRAAGSRDRSGRGVVVHPRAGPLGGGVNADELPRARRFAGLRLLPGLPRAAALLCRSVTAAPHSTAGGVSAAAQPAIATASTSSAANGIAGGKRAGCLQAGGAPRAGGARHPPGGAGGGASRAGEVGDPTGLSSCRASDLAIRPRASLGSPFTSRVPAPPRAMDHRRTGSPSSR